MRIESRIISSSCLLVTGCNHQMTMTKDEVKIGAELRELPFNKEFVDLMKSKRANSNKMANVSENTVKHCISSVKKD